MRNSIEFDSDRQFNKDDLDAACFSIQDTIGDITATPAGAAIIARMMEKARAKRGDVAQSAGNDQALQKMLTKMTVQGVLKQAGDAFSEDEIRSLNAALQKIKKPAAKDQKTKNYTSDQPLTEGAAEVIKEPVHSAIYPGKVWRDTEGKRIQAHGGALFYENGTYYWYGENKDRTDGEGSVWTWGIRAYASTDLYNWKDLGLIIEPELNNPQAGMYPEHHVDRPHILKCEKTGKYVCWIKQSGEEACFLILQADAFTGPYTVIEEAFRPFDMKVGDFDIIKDTATGKAYLYMDGDHSGIFGMELSEDFLKVEKMISKQYEGLHAPFCREAPAVFEHEGKKYMLTSGMSGYIPNKSDAAVSDSWEKPFASIGNPHIADNSNSSFNSQISQIFKVPGKKNLYITIADRWVPGYPVDAARADMLERAIASHYEPDKYQVTPQERQEFMSSPMLESANTSIADYVWLPLTFDGDRIQICWYDEWKIEDFE